MPKDKHHRYPVRGPGKNGSSPFAGPETPTQHHDIPAGRLSHPGANPNPAGKPSLSAKNASENGCGDFRRAGAGVRNPVQIPPQLTLKDEESGVEIRVLSGTFVGGADLQRMGESFRKYYWYEQFRVQYRDGAWHLSPCSGVTNKTFVNGSVAFDPLELKDGDVIAVGNPDTKKTVCPIRVVLPHAAPSNVPSPGEGGGLHSPGEDVSSQDIIPHEERNESLSGAVASVPSDEAAVAPDANPGTEAGPASDPSGNWDPAPAAPVSTPAAPAESAAPIPAAQTESAAPVSTPAAPVSAPAAPAESAAPIPAAQTESAAPVSAPAAPAEESLSPVIDEEKKSPVSNDAETENPSPAADGGSGSAPATEESSAAPEEEMTRERHLEELKKRADCGEVEAMFEYGAYLFKEFDSNISKSQEMVHYLEEAAKGDQPMALHYLGEIYYRKKGVVVPDNVEKSVECFTKAAAAGIVESMFILGEIYANGELGCPDIDKARKYWTKASKLKHEGAKRELERYPLPVPAGPVFSRTEADISPRDVVPSLYSLFKKELISDAAKELETVRAWKKEHRVQELPFAWKDSMASSGGQIIVEPPVDRDIWYVGDTHGDLLAFETAMQHILSQPGDPYVVILGDLIDRQQYSLEIILRLISLVISQPGQIVWIAGNHDAGLDYSLAELKFYSRTEPAEFKDWLNDHPEYTDIGLFFIEIVKTLPRAIYFNDGLCVVHGGVPAMYNLPDIKTFGDLYSKSTLYAYIWNRLNPDKPRIRGESELGWENVKGFLDVASDLLDFPVTRILRGHDHCQRDRYLFYEKYEEKVGIPVLTFVSLSAWTDSEYRTPEDQKTIATALNVAHHRHHQLPEIVRLKLDQALVEAFWQKD